MYCDGRERFLTHTDCSTLEDPIGQKLWPFFWVAEYVYVTYYETMEKVILDKVRRHLKRLPVHIVRNLQRWALQVEAVGIAEVRKIPGYHDEPLSGARQGATVGETVKALQAVL